MNNRAKVEYGNFKEIEVKVTTNDGHTFIYRFEHPEHGRKPVAEISYNVDTEYANNWYETPGFGFIADQRREFVLRIKN